MGMGSMQGMSQDPAYHTQRASMMMGQSSGYGHIPTNQSYSTHPYSRAYPRGGLPQGMHPSGMSQVMSKQVAMGLQQGVSHNYLSASNPVMGASSYMGGHYGSQHPSMNQTQSMQMGGQGISSIHAQSQLMQGYHGAHQGMGAVAGNNPYMLRNSLYPSQTQGIAVNQSMGYSHQPHRMTMPPISHMPHRAQMEPMRMHLGSQLQSIKTENPQHMMPGMLPPSGSSIVMPLDPHQPPSNPPMYPPYGAIPPAPIPVPDDSDFLKKAKEITAVFETYRTRTKDADSELIRKINRYIPLLKSKPDGMHDILQECEQMCKQIQTPEMSISEQAVDLNTNSLNFFSDNKFPDNRLPPDYTLEIPVNRSEHFLSAEIERLDPRLFSVHREQASTSTCFNLKLECHLKREGLPTVPPLIVKIPADYPSSSPESDLTEHYNVTPFLRQVRKCFTEEMVCIAGEYTLSHLLTCWERVVKNTCVTM